MRAFLAFGLVVCLSGAAIAQAPPAAAPPVPTVVKVGDMAPDFTLQGTDGKTHKLSDYRGKQAVVLAWFPKAFTAGCTIECKSLADNGDKIQKYQVTYFMASVDPLEDNIKFAKATSVTLGQGANARVVEKKEADFPMLSDPTKVTARAYGVVDDTHPSAMRWTFYIDKTGRVAAIDTAVRPATSAEDMLAKLAELKIPLK
ncbi:MAG: redoxin domain-containing protein [Acidobacteria bacterium]|nr:redoxin domain-containing protein [Acidobacteriota bacterium]